ncbi:TonB-dependent receptor [Prosthecochloris sp. N3]|uniref:TonB-dependent receptor n=1 Tax=Prosthecochloris ethylica TaxID=2743976 RepID=A0ABR9XSH8_9CHLB|nr:TonB-dependent receptor [Prosthecochloris ethylica]MBF0586683.1 TonB-dependent receptor [Prosthecochloris ethylica]MBF0636963.1 TonB-dependent receptor [Prosthecochloris ethylica]NUK47834.1 TonB-dependent receptor [Prosthecochloris ethylica]
MLNKKLVRQCGVLSALLLLSPSSSPAADQEGITWMQIDEITVTATKTERGISDAPVSVEIVTEEEIQNMGAVTLRDVFEQTPGVFINPGLGQMSVRGAGAFGTLVLVDGRRLSGERSFKYELNRIGAGAIERIEIVKGPMSVLYGSEAIGGVINIITKKPDDQVQGSLNVQAGSNYDGDGERYSVDGSVRGAVDELRYSGYFSFITTDPYTEKEVARPKVFNAPPGDKTKVPPSSSSIGYAKNNIPDSYISQTTYRDDSDVFTIGGSLDYSLSDRVEIGADVSYMKEERTSEFVGAQYPSANVLPSGKGFPVFSLPIYEELDTERIDLAGRVAWQAAENLELKWKSYGSWYEKHDTLSPVYYEDLGYTERPDGGGTCYGEVSTISHELTAQWSAGNGHELLFGAEHLDAERKSPWFAEDRTPTTVGYITRSAYAQDEWSLTEKLDLVYGMRFDSYSEFDDQVTGSVGMMYAFNEALRARVNYGQGYRAPSAPELYMNRNTPKGRVLGAQTIDLSLGKTASDIEPEASDNIELGLSGRGESWMYEVSAFYNSIDDRIGQVSQGGYYTFTNVGDARIKGIEGYLGFRFLEDIDLNTGFTVMDAENETTGHRLDYTPEVTLSVSADYRPVSNLLLNAGVFYTGDQTYEKNMQRFVADDYTFVNLKLSWMPEFAYGGEIYAGVDNLFDDDVDKELGSTVGTFGYVGMRYMF